MFMTKKEIEKVIEYLSISGRLARDFKGYSKMYAMTTENISEFLNKYDLRNKKVLTVTGSGDQRYNCYLKGAKEVVCFDINPLAGLHVRLKDTAMQNLEYQDFLKFFGIIIDDSGNCFLDKSIFNKIKDSLDEDVYLLYDFIINHFKADPFKRVYHDYNCDYNGMIEFDNYIIKDNYEKLKSIMKDKDFKFLNTNISSLPELLKGEKFDVILLSNISDYIDLVYGNDHMKMYKELIDRLVDNLYDNGIIQVGYVYNLYSLGETNSKFRFPESRNKVFPFNEYPVEFVSSFNNPSTYDKVITYQKK